MEKQFRLAFNGQAVQKEDLEQIAETAALADDRVFAELFRMLPCTNGGTVTKGILPCGPTTAAVTTSKYLFEPGSANGSVDVQPIRVFVGSRTTMATEAKKNHRDVRSAITIADGATARTTTVTFASNATGNSRWDAIYAVLTLDVQSSTVTRKVKDTTSSVVTAESVATITTATATIASVAGTAGASPAYPSIPADSSTVFNVLLGYVRIPTGFTSGSTVLKRNINIVAPVIGLAGTVGGSLLRPSTSNVNGVGVSGTGTSAANGVQHWTGTSGTRPGVYMPPTMAGAESRLIALDLSDDTAVANWSHQSFSVIDNSVDWRNRIFKWTAVVGKLLSTAAVFPWVDGTVATLMGKNIATSMSLLNHANASGEAAIIVGTGQSFNPTGDIGEGNILMLATGSSNNLADPVPPCNVPTNAQAPSTTVYLYVDGANLKLGIIGVPTCSVFIWLEATAQFSSYGS